MKRFFVIIVLSIICLGIFSCVANSYIGNKEEEAFYAELISSRHYEIPLCAGDNWPRRRMRDKKDSHQIVGHTGYTLCYREKYEESEWVAYTLDAEKLEKKASRTDDFREDPDIKTGSASLEDYRKSGFDRGHLAPAADFAYSEKTMSESFFMSNMTPQTHSFNAGIWKQLEQYVRNLAKEHERLYIVTGPVLEKNSYDTIGANRVAVPEYFYKVILTEDSGRDTAKDYDGQDEEPVFFMQAYIIPQRQEGKRFEDYKTSVDEVERRTGIDFFFLLDDDIENELEKL